MKKTLLLFSLVFTANLLFSQCSDLFISEYVEGYSNNKALEIYNPTSNPINLSEYSIVRFRNGATTAAPPNETPSDIIPLPNQMLEAKGVFVVVLDKQDISLWDSQFDKPVWDGTNLIDTLFDFVTGVPILDDDGNVIFGPQFTEDGSALFGPDYDERYDLQCKADAFLCPVWEINRAMYYNGNDAVALIRGTELAQDGSNLIDVFGVIGEDTEITIMELGWVNADGFVFTRDRTLVRNPEVTSGRSDLNDVVFDFGGTFTQEEWSSYPRNSFDFLGIHNSVCNSTEQPDRYSCTDGPLSTFQINQIAFSMFPNPNASKELTVEAAEHIESIEIFNLLGQRVLQRAITGTSQATINIAGLGKGMYLVNLHFADNHLSIQRLVVD